jgi:hypothetical protein
MACELGMPPDKPGGASRSKLHAIGEIMGKGLGLVAMNVSIHWASQWHCSMNVVGIIVLEKRSLPLPVSERGAQRQSRSVLDNGAFVGVAVVLPPLENREELGAAVQLPHQPGQKLSGPGRAEAIVLTRLIV